MENLETVEQENRNELILELQAEVFLREGRKWAKFLAILGFIGIGFGAIIALIMLLGAGFAGFASTYSSVPFVAIGFFYLVIIGIYFFPIYYLLQFANKAKEALDSRSSQSLTESMRYLKGHYKFLGVMTIVMFALYPIGMIVAIVAGVSQGM
ncbi:hypothetical protein L3073_08835 [Ancylomarina sp. DW003]|nr:hypothetical protein [Ancylomarina sp. DW003]MDE5422307.1 hypothetical protein [Ancylomarina sp. DW003]